MKQIKALYQTLQEQAKFEEKYPFYKEKDGKIHILYISPCINGTGYYRMITPMLELNKTTTHAALISSLHKWSFAKGFDDYDNPIDKRLIQWADYVVLPAMFSDISYILQAFNSINDDLQFVMDIDCNYHRYPKEHPSFEKTSDQELKVLLNNIAQMDILLGSSLRLLLDYEKRIAQYHPSSSVYMEFQPNLISDFGIQEISTIKRNDSSKFRIGIIGNLSGYYDILTIKEVLFTIKKKYEDKVELIFFGWNGKLPSGEEALKELDFTTQKSVSFLSYYEKLNDLAFDLVLLPLKNIPFNTTGKSAIKYLEASSFSIPVIASDVYPYKNVIKDKETGLLVTTSEEWITQIEQLIQNPKYGKQLGQTAFQNLWRNHSYTSTNRKIIQDIFI